MSLTNPLQQVDRTFVRQDGRKLIYFGGCDYFRLSSHPRVLRALQTGLRRFGLNVAASRSTTGNHILFGALEDALATFFGQPAAALFSSGYVTNLAFVQTFAHTFTHALIDERSHGSLQDAAALLRCPVHAFAHRDIADFKRQLGACGGSARPLVLTDGLFSHDGSTAPLRDYLSLLPRKGILLVDDAHGAGILGRRGRGTPELHGVQDERVVQTISLSKAFGVYGGAILGSAELVAAIQERSHIFKGNTPLPLPLASATLQSVRLLRRGTAMRQRLDRNTARLKQTLARGGFPVLENTSPLVALVPSSVQVSARINRELLRRGVFPSLIRYVGGPPHGFFRFAISREHSARQLDTLAAALLESA